LINVYTIIEAPIIEVSFPTVIDEQKHDYNDHEDNELSSHIDHDTTESPIANDDSNIISYHSPPLKEDDDTLPVNESPTIDDYSPKSDLNLAAIDEVSFIDKNG